MRQEQHGFTLIELVMVIVILGVLAAVAVPKFVNLKSDAQTSALKGVVGGITSASAVNYAARSVSTGYGTTTAALSCSAAATAILQGGIPNGYQVAATVLGAAGTSTSCLVTQTDGGATGTATIIGI